MDRFLKLSIEYAQQRSYLDDLFSVYPTIPNGIRDIDKTKWLNVEQSYNNHDNVNLIKSLLQLELFPLKDSYVSFLKHDAGSISRNPKTINRLASEIYEMGLGELYKNCTLPKESNRQIGPMFKAWITNQDLGFPTVSMKEFSSAEDDAICMGTDKEMKTFAQEKLGYIHNKGIDFLARVNQRYIIGEAKFLTDFEGHQWNQFSDAIATLETRASAIKIAILDGVLYINSRNKMYKDITGVHSESHIMSALLLRTFLFSL